MLISEKFLIKIEMEDKYLKNDSYEFFYRKLEYPCKGYLFGAIASYILHLLPKIGIIFCKNQ